MSLMDGWDSTDVPGDEVVLRRLAELGIPLAVLHESLRRGCLAADFCTEAHPVFYPGWRVYGEINGELRGQLAQLGWSFNDDLNIPRAISPDGAVVITAISGDSQTGFRNGPTAQTRRPRGSGGQRIIRYNAQYPFAELLPADDPELTSEPFRLGPTWFLLYHRDDDKIRSELSLARDVDEHGVLIDWAERLILPELDLLDDGPNGGRRRDSDDGGPDVDVPVVLRSA